MTHVTLAFSSKRSSLISWLIRRVQRWRHSHVVMISPDGQWYIESTGDEWIEGEALRNGVRVMPIAYLYERDDIEFRVIEHPDPQAVWSAALRYRDCRYDHRYLLSAFLGDDAHDLDKLSCPELIRQSFLDTGIDPISKSVAIPWVRDFYMVTKEMR